MTVLDLTPNRFRSWDLKRSDYGLPADASAEEVAAKAEQGDLYLTLPVKEGPAAGRARLTPLRGATLFPLELPAFDPETPNWSYIDRVKQMSRSQIAALGDAFLEAHRNDQNHAASVSRGGKYALVRPDGESFVLKIGELNQNPDRGKRRLEISMFPLGRIPWGVKFYVVDTQGKPVAGATARFSLAVTNETRRRSGAVQPARPSQKVEGVAIGPFHGDAQGCIRLPPLPRATFHGEVTAPGFVPHDHVSGSRNQEGRYNLPGVDGKVQLKRPGAIEGRVLDPRGKPLVHAPLSLIATVEYPSNVTQHTLRAISDEQGRFRIDGVPPGKHRLCYPWSGPSQEEIDSGRWRAFETEKDGGLAVPLPLAGYGLVKPVTVSEGRNGPRRGARFLAIDLGH